jgi:hypothetical protein
VRVVQAADLNPQISAEQLVQKTDRQFFSEYQHGNLPLGQRLPQYMAVPPNIEAKRIIPFMSLVPLVNLTSRYAS